MGGGFSEGVCLGFRFVSTECYVFSFCDFSRVVSLLAGSGICLVYVVVGVVDFFVCFKLKRNHSTLNHLQNLGVWNLG